MPPRSVFLHFDLYTKQKRADLIIGADTVVAMDGQIYEKPKDDEDAFRMLSRYVHWLWAKKLCQKVQ